MVKKVVNIDATVEKVIEAYRNIPPYKGTDPDEERAYEVQRHFARVQGEMVRFLMEATNRGDDITAILNILMSFSAQALVNVVAQMSKDDLESIAGSELQFPDDPLHSAIHMLADRFGPILHLHMHAQRAKEAGASNTVIGAFGLGEKIEFDLKEVGDA
jgi:hypothetical protein